MTPRLDRDEESRTSRTVREIVSTYLGVDVDRVLTDSKLEDLGTDSLDRVEILMELENEFGVTIDDPVADGWTTVGQIIETVEERLS